MRMEERKRIVVDLVLTSTLSVLEAVGFNRLRIADVAAHSGVSEAKLYRHFDSKNDLLCAVLSRSLTEHRDRIVESYIALGGKEVSRQSMLQLLWDATDHPQTRWTNELYASASLDPELGPMVREVLMLHNASIDAMGVTFLQATNVDAGEHADTLVNMLSWTMQGLAINNHGSGNAVHPQGLVNYFAFLADAAFGEVGSDASR